MIQPNDPIQIEGFQVLGIHTHTSNQIESEPTTARIGPLWERYVRSPSNTTGHSHIAVYSNYASDENGPYRFSIGKKNAAAMDENQQPVMVPSGPFSLFHK